MHAVMPERKPLIHVHPALECCDPVWEAAYARFETAAAERAKFGQRLRALGVGAWPRELRVVELFCGRGNALKAWADLGYAQLDGVDLSATLLAQYDGPAQCYVCDCRELPFADASREVLAVQGGLHHLPRIPEDLLKVLSEARRVLVADGKLLVVEPWQTPFLAAVHRLSSLRPLRSLWAKLDAFAVMVEREAPIYQHWLAQPAVIRDCFEQHFRIERWQVSFGKLAAILRPRPR